MFETGQSRAVHHRHWASTYDSYHSLPEEQGNGTSKEEVLELPKEAILRWFLAATMADASWVLRTLTRDRRYRESMSSLFEVKATPPTRAGSVASVERGRSGSAVEGHECVAARSSAVSITPSLSHSLSLRFNQMLGRRPSMEDQPGGSPGDQLLLDHQPSREPTGLAREISCIDVDKWAVEDDKNEDLEAGDEMEAVSTSGFYSSGSDDGNEESKAFRRLTKADQFAMQRPIVQFASKRNFCIEGETYMSLDVMRIGNLRSRSSVRYTTLDASAKAGVTYEATQGVLVFQPGENRKSIDVPLIDDDSWNPTLEFAVVLLNDDIENAILDRYQWETWVSVMDDDAFPTNRFKEIIAETIKSRKNSYFLGKLTDVPKLGLLIEYFKLNLRDPVVRWGTIKILISDQLLNLYFFLKLFLNVYLVDFVLKTSTPTSHLLFTDSRAVSLLLITCAIVVPFAFLHYLAYIKYSWRVKGVSRRTLQAAMIRKFLNYKNEVRMDLSQGTLILAMTRDAENVVDKGYMAMFALFKSLGSIMLMLVYQFIAPVVFGKPLRGIVILPMIIYPVCMFLFIMARGRKTLDCQELLNDALDEMITHVDNIVLNYQVISEYDSRAPFVKRFEDKVIKLNNQASSTGQTLENNAHFAPWLSLVLVAIYMIKGGLDVLNGNLSLGTYLIDVHIFQQIGVSWGAFYSIVLQLQASIPRLERVTTLLNFPIDLPQRKSLFKYRRTVTKKLRAELFEAGCAGLPVDLLPVRVTDPSKGHGRIDVHLVSDEAEVNMRQGRLVYLLGPHGEGKSALLRLLSGASLPAEDDQPYVFVPSHLRALHVSSEPLFFGGSLYDNLVLGVRPEDKDGNMERVMTICRRLGLPRFVRAQVESGEIHMWGQKLSQTQRQLLSLARALIANPEFLCVHKPVQVLDEFTTGKVLELFHEFVTCRGLEQDPAAEHLRRPRTCVITSNQKLNPKFAHTICHVSVEEGITMSKDDD